MFKCVVVAAALLAPLTAQAQQPGHMHSSGMPHDGRVNGLERTVDVRVREPGQSAFAAIQEIVDFVAADPATDWSRVNIDALRRHLIDMDNVTLSANVMASPVEGGMRYVVTGTGAVRESVARLVRAHAETMDEENGMRISAEDHPDGAVMTVIANDPADLPTLGGLGFIGIMTLGAHHQEHHLMIARGEGPHG